MTVFEGMVRFNYHRRLSFIATFCLLDALCEPLSANDRDKSVIITIRSSHAGLLSVCDGEVVFHGTDIPKDIWREHKKSPDKLGERIYARTFVFRQTGEYLQVHYPQASEASGVNAYAKPVLEGFYLTADYSRNPPRVTLEERPTEYSRWTVQPVPTEPPTNQGWYWRRTISNVNDRGERAWLEWIEEGKLRKHPEHDSPVYLRVPVLRAESKNEFEVRRYKDDSP